MIVLRILMLMLPLASAVIINCEFRTSEDWSAVGEIYCCYLASDPQITLPNIRVTEVTGNHESYRTNKDVLGFYSGDSSETVEYMPQGLDIVFPNLIAIFINNGSIKELHQSDFQAYTKLQFLDLGNNDIAFLEEDLFKHNTGLKLIYLHHNKIAEIHPTVFDHLTQLAWLWLGENLCVSRNAGDNRQIVLEIVEDIRGKCVPGPLLKANQKKQKLEDVKKIIASLKEKYPNEMKKLMACNETPGERTLLQFVALGILSFNTLALLCVAILICIDFGRLQKSLRS